MKLFLASTSVYRQELLSRLGVEFQSIDPGLDEEPFKRLGLPPRDLAERLARQKCLSARSRIGGDGIVLGSDQVVSFEGAILGKPGSAAAACQQLARLAGRTHELITAVCFQTAQGEVTFVDSARLTLRPLASDEIVRYVQADCSWDCAGSYKIEKLGISLFDRIDAQDFTSIQGLPLMAVARILRELGQPIP